MAAPGPAPDATPTAKKKKASKDKKKDKEEKNREKENEKTQQKEKEPEVVTCSFAGNEYAGILRTDYLGCRSLEGLSKYTWASGVKYEGPFVASHIEGRGKFTWPDGSVYEGEISNGKRHGEGIYLGADGITKYEGQWMQGKRHGVGRLSYDVIGEAHYHGCWEDGWKHGEGRQVWPSGNVYEGQWRFGKMAGWGTMSWRDGGAVEQYAGNWEDDHPQGEGTHTWLAPEAARPGLEPSGKEGPAQQMNNRYHGAWHRGVRHGEGSFFYANGAKYCGSWVDNAKQGEGRYTFEDGKVYSGAFVNDQMKDYSEPDAMARAALNIGGEDNPVRRCIDVSDLEIFAMPPGVGNVPKGYDESQEVMREVHNTLLRYLGELKNFYQQYRKILPRSGDDPFVLSMHQLWGFARDFDLLTPSFTLSSFNRCTLSGPRHHQEATGEEEMQELRPLTPRQHVEHPTRRFSSHTGAVDPAGAPEGQAPLAAEPAEQAEPARLGFFEQSDVGSSVPESESEGGPSTPQSPPDAAEEGAAEPDGDAPHPPADPLSPDSPGDAGAWARPTLRTSTTAGSLFGAAPPPLYTKFWRRDGAGDVVDIHSPESIMMFRHFLEMFVRVAVARYPNEKGLVQQISRLFKDTLVPRLSRGPRSEPIFEFLLDPGVSQVFSTFHGELWRLFRDHAVGDGVYGTPQWVPQASLDLETGGGAENAGEGAPPASPKPPMSASSSAPGLGRSTSGSAEAAAPAPHVRSRRRGHGGHQRRMHVRARMDVTVRVKDVLRLLDSMGLLTPPGQREKYPPFLADIHSSVFPDESPIDPLATSSDMAQIADLAGLKDMLPGEPSDGSQADGPAAPAGARGSAGKLGETPDGQGDPFAKVSASARSSNSQGFGALTAGNPRESNLSSCEKIPGVFPRASGASNASHVGSDRVSATAEPEPAVLSEASASEVLSCDFKLSIIEVLRLVSEVSSPDSLQQLCWAVRGEELAEGRAALLEFVETELAFCEFQRLLLRISERKTQQLEPALAERLPRHRRLEGFLAHVFLPSLGSRYEPPLPPPPPAPEPSAEEATEPAAEGEELPEQAGIEGEGPPKPEARPFELWQGFDGHDLHLQEETVAARQWPEEYAESVGAW